MNAIVTINPENAVQAAQAMKQIIQAVRGSVLVEGVDYGVIPGTTKPTLLKPGAERLCSAFGLYPEFISLEGTTEDWQGEFFHYRYRCILRSRETGQVYGEGIGSCNSKESKYRWRNAERVCPECGKAAIIKGKEQYGGGWLCFAKKGGCGAKFTDSDPVITSQEVGRIENDDICSQVNSIDKISQKRAFIAATLVATNASEFFTQDMEDFTPGVIIEGTLEDVPVKTNPSGTHTVDPNTGEAVLKWYEERDVLHGRIYRAIQRGWLLPGSKRAELETFLGKPLSSYATPEELDKAIVATGEKLEALKPKQEKTEANPAPDSPFKNFTDKKKQIVEDLNASAQAVNAALSAEDDDIPF